METWTEQNPDWEHLFYDDEDALAFFRMFAPEHYELYKAMHVINRADFFRYVVLLKRGGVYADADTKCKVPVDQWLPRSVNTTGKAIVGIEHEPSFFNDFTYAYTHQFLQWTMAGPAGHPVFQWVVDTIARTHAPPSFKFTGKRKNLDYHHSVLYSTGPGVWTDAVNQYITGQGFGVDYVFDQANDNGFAVVGDLIVLCEDRLRTRFVEHESRGSWKRKKI